jgi:ankyrin repeat protein
MNKLSRVMHTGFSWAASVVLPACVIAVLWHLPDSSQQRPMDDRYEALLIAIDRNDIAAVQRCLARGTPAEVKGVTEITPLMSAARYGRLEIAELLLLHGANLHASARGVGTPLANAAMSGKSAVVQFLLAHGADASAGDGGLTPLMAAVLGGHVDVAEILILAGADVNGQNRFGESALLLAEMDGNDAMYQRLADGGVTGQTASASTGGTCGERP